MRKPSETGVAALETVDGAHARFDVLGVPVSAIDMADAVSTIDGWIRARTPHYVCVTGVHGVMESQRDEGLRLIHERAGMVTPDGMPLVWIAHLEGRGHVERVYGPDLMLACCKQSLHTGARHYFFGGAEGIADRLAARLSLRFPGLAVAGTYCPPFRPLTPAEDERLVDTINAANADIVWVGLSTPKQERWMAAHVSRLRAPVLVGVGAAFDFHAGVKRQAPRWMQQNGLEWCFRLASEPRRLGRRYLINNPAFVWSVARARLRAVRLQSPGLQRRSS
jgi:N-acetylglucosaminyldiphosphoundecaprenol N-acetyl-beta-D-mannosaminyltransferase